MLVVLYFFTTLSTSFHLASLTGLVEEVGHRVVKLRDFNLCLHPTDRSHHRTRLHMGLNGNDKTGRLMGDSKQAAQRYQEVDRRPAWYRGSKRVDTYKLRHMSQCYKRAISCKARKLCGTGRNWWSKVQGMLRILSDGQASEAHGPRHGGRLCHS